MWHLLRPHQFSYSLTRPYPYPWFPCVTGIVLSISTIIFSTINLAAVGYELELQFTINPNETLDNRLWTEYAPFSWFGQTRASCQPQSLPVQSQIFTNNSGFTYSIERIYHSRDNGRQQILPSLTYLNNTIRDCNVTWVNFDIASTGRTPEQTQSFSWGIEALIYATCRIDASDQPTFIDLHVSYDFFSAFNQRQRLLELNQTSRASLWWGQKLIAWQYLNLARIVADLAAQPFLPEDDSGLNLYFARAIYDERYNSTHTNPNMTSFRYAQGSGFRVLCFQTRDGTLEQQGSLTASWLYPPRFCSGIDSSASDETIGDFWPSLWQPCHDYAMVLASTALVDLGNNNTENLLTSPEYLQYYSSKFRDINATVDAFLPTIGGYWIDNMPSDIPYEESKNTTGSLEIAPATIFAQYICEVPRQKSTGSLIINIFVADLVFLSAMWTLLNFITTSFLEYKDPEAMYCMGCLELKKQVLGIAVQEMDNDVPMEMQTPRSPPTSPSPPRSPQPVPPLVDSLGRDPEGERGFLIQRKPL